MKYSTFIFTLKATVFFPNFETQRSLKNKLISLPAGGFLVSDIDLNNVSLHNNLEARRKKDKQRKESGCYEIVYYRHNVYLILQAQCIPNITGTMYT